MTSLILLEAVQEVQHLVQQFRTRAYVELEGRLGRFHKEPGSNKHTFKPGVIKTEFHILLSMMEEYDAWTAKKDWEDSVDYFYPNVRATATEFHECKFVSKRRLAQVDILCEQREYSCRISCKQENPLPPDPMIRKPDSVRIKRRKSFEHKKTWRFDFTMTKGNAFTKTKEMALREPIVYEIEVELLQNPQHLEEKSDPSIAASLLEKMVDLLHRHNGTYSLKVISSRSFDTPYDPQSSGSSSPSRIMSSSSASSAVSPGSQRSSHKRQRPIMRSVQGEEAAGGGGEGEGEDGEPGENVQGGEGEEEGQ